MPLDKFGRHMLRSRLHPIHTSTTTSLTSPFYICEPSSYHSKCIIYIHGQVDQNKSVALYVLDNTNTDYKFPVSGKIENVQIFPSKTSVFLNGVGVNNIEGKIVKKGDTLSFSITSMITVPLYVQIVIQCPLIQDV